MLNFLYLAELLGRGPVQIQAIAVAENTLAIASSPLDLVIQGDLAEVMRNTESPKKK